MAEELKGLVRIGNKDIPGKMPIYRGLANIYGVGRNLAKGLALVFQEKEGIPFDQKIGTLTDEQIQKLRAIVEAPEKKEIPAWMVNIPVEYETGKPKHLISANLQLEHRNTLKRLQAMKSYRGLRLSWGLRVRGQRTKSSGRVNGKKGRYRKNKKR